MVRQRDRGDDRVVADMPPTVRVLIVDDQDAFRSAARMVIELTDGFEVVGEAGSVRPRCSWSMNCCLILC